jgi:hypothetical protein
MPGGVLQLAAYGSEDIYFTGNPQISFFKNVYKRYTNFATESVNMTFDKIPDFRSGSLYTNCKIQRAGDLVKNMFLRMKLPSVNNYNYIYNSEDMPVEVHSFIINELQPSEQIIPVNKSHMRVKSNIFKMDLGALFTNDDVTGIKLDGHFAIENSPSIQALDLINNVTVDSSDTYTLEGIVKIPIEADIEDVTKYPIDTGSDIISLFEAYQTSCANNTVLVDRGLTITKNQQSNYTIYELPVVFRARVWDIQDKPDNPQTYSDGGIEYKYYYIEWGDVSYPYGALINYLLLDDFTVFSINQWQTNVNYNAYKFMAPEFDTVYTHTIRKNPYNNNINYFPNKNYKGSIKNFRWDLNIAKTVTLFINGLEVVKLNYDYLIAELLSRSSGEKKKMLDRLIGNITALTNPENSSIGYPTPEYELFVPLPFWFSKDSGWALPLVALPKSVVELRVDFNNISDENNTTNNFSNNSFYKGIPSSALNITDISLDVEYVYLDKTERTEFARNTHEYLIEQVQSNIFTNLTGTTNAKLNFLHPVSEILMYVKNEKETNKYPMNALYGYNPNVNFIKNIRILFNGNERLQPKPILFFNTLQPYLTHTGDTFPEYQYITFSMNPEGTQPMGSCNFSRINNVLLEIEFDTKYLNKTFIYDSVSGLPLTLTTFNDDNTLSTDYQYAQVETKLYVYAKSYNVLSIIGGLGGVKFAS